MSAVGALLGLGLLVFELILIARVVLDRVGVLAPGGGVGLVRIRGWTHAVSEPVIAPGRRVLRPVRLVR
jgi:YggT family protein